MKPKIKTFFPAAVIAAIVTLFSGIERVYAVVCDAGFAPTAGVCFPVGTGLSNQPARDVLSNFMVWLLVIFGVITIIAFVVSGLQYLTAAGDEDQASTAKRNMIYSIVGVIVGLSGYIILNAVTNAYNLNPVF